MEYNFINYQIIIFIIINLLNQAISLLIIIIRLHNRSHQAFTSTLTFRKHLTTKYAQMFIISTVCSIFFLELINFILDFHILKDIICPFTTLCRVMMDSIKLFRLIIYLIILLERHWRCIHLRIIIHCWQYFKIILKQFLRFISTKMRLTHTEG